MRKPPHTIIHYNAIWARLTIPADVRAAFDNETLFLEKIGPSTLPYDTANAMAAALVARWKQKIRVARSEEEIDIWRYQVPGGGGSQDLGDDVLAIMQDPDDLRNVARDLMAEVRRLTRGLPREAMPAPSPLNDTGFLDHFEDWKTKTHLKGKTLDQASSDIKQFAAAVPETLGSLTGSHVQSWIETLSKKVSAVTVRRKLSALRSYWEWLQSHEIVSPDRKPFEGRTIKDRRTKVEQALVKRQRFEPADVVKLWEAAASDRPLHALIRLAAFTGARREGLASLQINLVVSVEGIDCLRLQEKTEAGIRTVPIHPEIATLVADLAKNSTDGFLIQSETDKYGHRGDALGKRFTKLKTDLKFDKLHTFHSLRHTVVHLFREAECPVEIRNQILGHEDGDTGAGSGYGGHVGEKLKLDWLVKAIRYEKLKRQAI